jgi:hypothetical protein
MARDVTLGRDMAEKIIEALEEFGRNHNDGCALDYADMIKREFGIPVEKDDSSKRQVPR